ncbi:hypothetical protein [Stenotrophomonas forensis]|uniref:hypothetical protein n=1 Tax=Stenotrophomonas forensis TaxID=2871169 RepID=UPI0018D31B8B|nr:hypothetical protein [Stenotrophomonas maltophilia]MBH1501898.1 hypothetical protein [Stenotrophomonas maltophilia]MBH1785091.1 hypothetical protein [Stenotrophomonas maltophilia]
MISQEVIAKALSIADDAVRCDIELYAVQQEVEMDGKPCWIYSTTQAQPLRDSLPEELRRNMQFAETPVEALRHLQIVQRAVEYIRERSHIFEWALVEVDGFPGFVRFVEKVGP